MSTRFETFTLRAEHRPAANKALTKADRLELRKGG